jgi:hypothetical protein
MLKTFLLLLLLAAVEPTEKPATYKAADLLPASIVNGAHSQVLDPVTSDGYLYVYQLKSRYGQLQVVSTATLLERAHEFDMMAQMEKLKGTQQFADAVKGKLGKVVQGGANLITDPLGTTEKAFTGVGRMFRSIGTAIGGGGQAGGDGTVSEMSGYSAVKRQYARKFGVDPYSRNQYLQTELTDVSRAGFLGGTMTSLGLGMVGGAAGTAITVASSTEQLGELVSQPPEQVDDYCSDKLSQMGVGDDLSDLFRQNENFTITERTAIVMDLNAMSTTQNRQGFIKLAVLTHDPDVGTFRRRQADMYAAYHQKVKPVAQFQFQNNFAAGVQADGTVVVMAPVDRLLWTDDMAAYITSATAQVQGAKKLLWLTGTASPLALQNLAKAGWEVKQKATF